MLTPYIIYFGVIIKAMYYRVYIFMISNMIQYERLVLFYVLLIFCVCVNGYFLFSES